MGRWLVILSLAMAQYPDIAAAETQSSGIPVPKPRPAPRAASPAIRAAVTSPDNPAVAAPGKPSVSESIPGFGREPVQEPVAQLPAQNAAPETPQRQPRDPSEDLIEELAAWGLRPTIEDETPRRSIRTGVGCNGGKRIVSAYYWQGKFTASGQPFDPKGMTAAHRTLPFGTRLTVSNPRNGQSVVVVVNDRGPFVSGVDLDLSLGAAQAIGMQGTGAVCIE